MRKTGILLVFFVAFAAGIAIPQGTGAGMQTQQPQSLVAEVKGMYDPIIGYITKAADQFPEDKYGWQPTPDVRTFGRHFADDTPFIHHGETVAERKQFIQIFRDQ